VALGEVAGLEWEGRWVVQEAEGCEAIIETRDRWILVEIRGKWTLAVPRLTCLALEEASEARLGREVDWACVESRETQEILIFVEALLRIGLAADRQSSREIWAGTSKTRWRIFCNKCRAREVQQHSPMSRCVRRCWKR
jgi:hypothetical protein